ncbi:MAG: hypothetical protein M3R27_05310 [Bacteroidota bacterium]|nr:hypothetical protein [Bacteroidota bacterium]
MKKNQIVAILVLILVGVENLNAQAVAGKVTKGSYTFRNSSAFETPKGYAIQKPLMFSDGILQMSVKGTDGYHFQWFSNEMRLMKENTIDLNGKFGNKTTFSQFLQLKSKVYVIGREVFKESGTEGICAFEIDHKSLNVKGDVNHLFESSRKVKTMGFGFYGGGMVMNLDGALGYDLNISEDKTKFMYSFCLAPKEKRDKLNKDEIGIFVFDENLTKIWGGEVVMPYSEAKMENLGFTVTNDGKVCLLAKVYDGEDSKDGAKDKTKPNYHFEVIIYQEGSKTPKIAEIKLDNYFNREVSMFQDKKGNIVFAGFYGKKGNNGGIDGTYMLTLDVDKGSVSKVNGGFYEIPSEFIKTFMSERQLKKTEKKEEKEDFDLELTNLVIRDMFSVPDGSTTIVSEIYWMEAHTSRSSNGTTSTYYTYNYNDIVIMNIKGGKMEWIKKIKKFSENSYPYLLSINSVLVGNDVHVFWKDKPENSFVAEGQKPAKFNGRDGMLRACKISARGEMKFEDIVNLERYDIRCSLREYINNGSNTLSNTERSKKQNVMFAIDVK